MESEVDCFISSSVTGLSARGLLVRIHTDKHKKRHRICGAAHLHCAKDLGPGFHAEEPSSLSDLFAQVIRKFFGLRAGKQTAAGRETGAAKPVNNHRRVSTCCG